MLVQGRAATGRALMVAAEGRARVVGGSEAQEVNRRLRAKYLRPEVLDAIGSVWGGLDDVAIEITPDRWRSWSASPFRDATGSSRCPMKPPGYRTTEARRSSLCRVVPSVAREPVPRPCQHQPAAFRCALSSHRATGRSAGSGARRRRRCSRTSRGRLHRAGWPPSI